MIGRKITPIATSWVSVFNLASRRAGIEIPSPAAITRYTLIAISRAAITIKA